jgi:16S rRNA C1402 (ribose-2'-O) methylase RsmI
MFPILRMLRSHFENAKIIVIATAILHNIAIKFGEVEPEEDDDVLDLLRAVIQQMDTPEVEAHRAVEQAAEAAARDAGVPGVADPGRRIEGQLHRDQLKLNMPPQGRRRVARN